LPDSIPRFNGAELRILLLLGMGAMHVRPLRAELDDYGSVSRHLKHLEGLGYIRRERIRGKVMNTLTPKGRRVSKALEALRT